MNSEEINNEIGDIDLFLLDLILKGNVPKDGRILDAGCGSGRNMFYFLKRGYNIKGVDSNESEVNAANFLSRNLGRGDVCSIGLLDNLPLEQESFDLIVCSRVLHFANFREEFNRILAELSRVLSSKGLLYLSVDSMIGMESKIEQVDQNKYQFPDGSVRFMLTEDRLNSIGKEWIHAMEPRTVNFHGQHAETTLVLTKN